MTTTANKMALLRRPGEQPTPVPESVASSDEQLAQLFPGVLDNALVHRERTKDGVLQVTIVQKALVEIEGRTLVVDDLEDVRSDEKAREWLVLIETWASNADIRREIVTDGKLGQALKLTVTKKAGPKGLTSIGFLTVGAGRYLHPTFLFFATILLLLRFLLLHT